MTFIQGKASYKKYFQEWLNLYELYYRDKGRPFQMSNDDKQVFDHVSRLSVAIEELHLTLLHMEVTRRLVAAEAPVHTHLRREEMLEVLWSQHQHQCYQFKEKLKLVFNQQKPLTELLDMEPPNWLEDELKKTASSLNSPIRDRGNSVQNWNVVEPNIQDLSWFGVLRNLSPEEENKYATEVSKKIEQHQEFTEQVFERVMSGRRPTPLDMLNHVKNRIENAEPIVPITRVAVQ